MDISRRSILGGVAGAGGALLAQMPAAHAEAAATAPAAGEALTIDLLGQPDRFPLYGCWLREANFRNFPASKTVSGGVISLAPGALRELHWHANAAEWGYVLAGHCRVSLIDPRGKSQTIDFAAGDIWYFPRGYGHAIQCLGGGECRFLLAFDSGIYSEYATFSLSDWLGSMPQPVLAQAFGTAAAFADIPKSGEFFAKASSPGPLPADPAPGTLSEGPLSCRYRLRAQRPSTMQGGGTIRIASAREFPLSQGMTSVFIELDPGKLRNPHWHPNANEWQYVVSGTARATIFLSHDRTVTHELPAGHLVYVPRGCGHFTESIGNVPLEVVAVLDNGTYESVEMTDWVRSNTAELLAANFRRSPQEMAPVLK